jgi:hypothetical protein
LKRHSKAVIEGHEKVFVAEVDGQPPQQKPDPLFDVQYSNASLEIGVLIKGKAAVIPWFIS